jgi:hypothetical protein
MRGHLITDTEKRALMEEARLAGQREAILTMQDVQQAENYAQTISVQRRMLETAQS